MSSLNINGREPLHLALSTRQMSSTKRYQNPFQHKKWSHAPCALVTKSIDTLSLHLLGVVRDKVYFSMASGRRILLIGESTKALDSVARRTFGKQLESTNNYKYIVYGCEAHFSSLRMSAHKMIEVTSLKAFGNVVHIYVFVFGMKKWLFEK